MKVETVSIDERNTLIQVINDNGTVVEEKRVRYSQASHYEKLLRQKHCKIVL